jgi:hypothetical protein
VHLALPSDAAATPLVKLDPGFGWDTADPNRIQLMRVFVSVVEADTEVARKETMRKTKETLDYAALAGLER